MTSVISKILKVSLIGGLLIYIIFVPLSEVAGGIFSYISFAKCTGIANDPEKTNCQRKAIRQAVKSGSIYTAVDLFKNAIKTSTIDCHFLGHEIGRDFYEVIKNNGYSRIGEPMPECGYGFWHGFMTGVAQDYLTEGSVGIDLNKVCPMMLGNKKDIYDICYHGFGIGFVGDPPYEENLGDVSKTIEKATLECDKITSVTIYNEQCYSGAFHQLLSYMQNSEYKYTFPKGEEVYRFCTKFGKSKIKPCLEQLGPVLTIVITHDVPTIVDLVKKKFTWVDTETKSRLLQTVVGGAVHANSNDKDPASMAFCFQLSGTEVIDCITGVFSGVKTKSESGDIKALEDLIFYCSQSGINIDGQKICIDFLKDSVKDPVLNKEVTGECAKRKDSSVCSLI